MKSPARHPPAGLALAALLALAGPTAQAQAQAVTGVVRDSASAAPLAGVLVTVLGVDGARVRGTLTDGTGRFALEVPLGRYRLQAERIGLRPAATEPFDLDTFNPRFVEIRMTDRAVEIAGLVVDGRVQSCRLDPEGAVRIQRWWREVRTALGVSAALQDERFAEFEVERFEREWDPDLRRIVASNRRVELSASSRPFVSETADFLSEGGFVQGELTGQRQYFAPDAEVLLSDTFLTEHCFSLTEDRDHRDQLGLSFQPTGDRTVPEIEGTLWVDTLTAELRTLDFRYANIDDVPDNESGGQVGFEYLPNGAWIVSDWYIRMPRVGVRRRRGRERYVLVGYVDVGGSVTPVADDRPPDVAGVAGAVRGVVFDSVRGVGLPDARVRILGTRFEATTDPAGQFVLTNVPVGRHRLTFHHPEAELWGLGSSFAEVEVRENLTSDARLAIPGFRQAALALCLGEGVSSTTILLGHVLGPDREPVARVPLEISWARPEADDGEPVQVFPASTGSDGRFVVCVLPPEVPISVRVQAGDTWYDAFGIVLPPGRIVYREVWITR